MASVREREKEEERQRLSFEQSRLRTSLLSRSSIRRSHSSSSMGGSASNRFYISDLQPSYRRRQPASLAEEMRAHAELLRSEYQQLRGMLAR